MTLTLPMPIVLNASRAARTWAALAVADRAVVVWPLNVSVNVPLAEPPTVTVCTSLTPRHPAPARRRRESRARLG